MKVGMELEFISEELSRNIEFFTTDYDDMLAVEDLLCDDGGETTWTGLAGCYFAEHGSGGVPKRCPLPSMTTVFSKEVIL